MMYELLTEIGMINKWILTLSYIWEGDVFAYIKSKME
jgi:hypothetical protein